MTEATQQAVESHLNPDEVVYRATPTGSKFHKSDAFVRLIMGPICSGKSVACCWELFRKACMRNVR